MSGAGNGGLTSGGRFEARDVIGSVQFAQTEERLKHMTIGLFSRCNGANATLFAMHTAPRHFDAIGCLLLCQPDAIPAKHKLLRWIYGTSARWDGYLEFQRHPEPMLDWLARHLA